VKSGAGEGSFSVTLTGLSPNTIYYVKAYASHIQGESYGNEVVFATMFNLAEEIIFNPDLTYGSVTDIEGNVYKTVQIGSQTWMAENLKTTKFNNDSAIPNVTDNSDWIGLSSSAYCWYNNDINNKNLIGALYNWFTVNTGLLCPTGWHVPTDNEWSALTSYIGGENIAGAEMKETGVTHWAEPNMGATNSSGFTALPGGQRHESDGTFIGASLYDVWWSSTEYNIYKSWYRSVATINTVVFRSSGSLKQRGFSIRCIKD
jgi:uncharacterized protein (TIGR02145 family)